MNLQLKRGCKSGCVDSDEDEGLGGCCCYILAITVTGSPVEVCVGCTSGMETSEFPEW